MFIMAVIDSAEEQQLLRRLLASAGHQTDFVGSEDDLCAYCRQTEPDALLLRSRYADVSARFLLKQLQAEGSDALPETVLVLAEPQEAGQEFAVSSGVLARWVSQDRLVACLAGERPDAPAEEAAEPKRILHISDDRLLRRIISDLIARNTAYALTSASDGRTGLAAYEDCHPDLILTDWDLPDTDGITLCRHIKLELNDDAVAVALFSSMTDEHLIEAAYAAKAKAYILKPVTPDKLLGKINRLMNTR